jgi:hypothetical protein
MFYKAKVAVRFEVHTEHINAMWAPWIIFECEAWWYVKLPLGFKRSSGTARQVFYHMMLQNVACLPPFLPTKFLELFKWREVAQAF